MNLFRKVKLNLGRFPTSWEDLVDWAYFIKENIAYRYKPWRFWYSPPWSKTRRCPGCAGSKTVYNSYDYRDCEVCHGEGIIPKS